MCPLNTRTINRCPAVSFRRNLRRSERFHNFGHRRRFVFFRAVKTRAFRVGSVNAFRSLAQRDWIRLFVFARNPFYISNPPFAAYIIRSFGSHVLRTAATAAADRRSSDRESDTRSAAEKCVWVVYNFAAANGKRADTGIIKICGKPENVAECRVLESKYLRCQTQGG